MYEYTLYSSTMDTNEDSTYQQQPAWVTLLQTAFVGDVMACSSIATALKESGAADVSTLNIYNFAHRISV